ncbi:MAG: hypothetical protein HFP76_08010, partial [Methylococcales symbiont of Iophon sp. n. MRB-2018]
YTNIESTTTTVTGTTANLDSTTTNIDGGNDGNNEIVVTNEDVNIDADSVDITGAVTNLDSVRTDIDGETINIGDGTDGTTTVSGANTNIESTTTTVTGTTANLNSDTTNIDSATATNINSDTINIGDDAADTTTNINIGGAKDATTLLGDTADTDGTTNINSENINIGDGTDGTTIVRGAAANLNSGTTTISTGNTKAVYNSDSGVTTIVGTDNIHRQSVIKQTSTEASIQVTHGEGHTNYVNVGTTETTLSGGTANNGGTKLTLDNKGARLSSTNGGSALLHGISDGVAPTDAVNVRQLTRGLDKATKGIALSMAMGSVPQAFNGESSVGLGFGHFDGQSAVALGGSHNDAENNMTYNLRVSSSFGGGDHEIGFSAGAGWSF